MKQLKSLFLALLMSFSGLFGQEYKAFDPDTVKAGRFDNGKMWTFDNPPNAYWKAEYGFSPDQKWMDFVRMSALRLPGCTGSFVSANGLVMTNHHCARDISTAVQKTGEDFAENGFYATKAGEERKLPDYYVDQLQKIEDITTRVQSAMSKVSEDAQVAARDAEFKAIKEEFAKKTGWEGLELQTLTFYSGGKYALYGFKRFKDVRLVFVPELQMGLFGGEPDNFSYPRYCLDMSFYRVYGDDGKPLNSAANFFKFNIDGVAEGTTTFVIGNPGSTARIRTVADLQFDRDLQNPDILEFLTNRYNVLKNAYEKAPKAELLNEILGVSNSIEAYAGQQKGLQDGYLWARRKAFEKEFKAAVSAKKGPEALRLWDDIAAARMDSRKNFAEAASLPTNAFACGNGFHFANLLVRYAELAKKDDKKGMEQLSKAILSDPEDLNLATDEAFLACYFKEAAGALGKDDGVLKAALNQTSATDWASAAKKLMASTKMYDKTERQKLIDGGVEAIMASSDPMISLAKIARPRTSAVQDANRALNGKLTTYRTKLAQLLFESYGTSIPPDATFSLRINDGKVQGYDYNGTKAIYKTTFYGLYERHFANNKKAPWDLPKRWQKPNPKILEFPMDFVTTNDIIGGNSGSAVINTKGEAIGLIFDGNPESLAGNYIYEPSYNRAVAVHTGGIFAALKYVYKAKGLYKELEMGK